MGTFTDKVVGIFHDRSLVDLLLNDLNSMGYDKGNISVLAKDIDQVNTTEHQQYHKANPLDKDSKAVSIEARVTSGLNDENNFEKMHDVSDKDPNAMIKGATAGGALGLIAGLGLLLIPGIGPVLATGTLLAALTAGVSGAAVGATAGTLIGLLKDEGIPKDKAEFYTNHFNNGDVLIFVGANEDQKGQLREIFNKHKAITIDTF